MPQTDRSTQFPSRLIGQCALVTGASQGIGRAVALRLAQEGATVAINYFDHPEKAEETLALTRTASSDRGHGKLDHVIVKADVGVETEIAAMFETILSRWKRLDCLVNNAGFQRESPSEALDVETYRRIIDVNLNGAVICAQKALAHFVARGGGGNIINCSSAHQIIPKPGYLAYSISKGGMANLDAYAGAGIRRPRHSRQCGRSRRDRHADQRDLDRRRREARRRREPHSARARGDAGRDRRRVRVPRLR